jgi:hypothetical protein
MAFSIEEMLGQINKRNGLSKSSKFMAYFREVPSGIGTLEGKRDLSFLCDAVSVPGIAYQSDDIRSSGYGNIEKRPYATIYNDVTLNFFCDNDGVVVDFMHKWLQSVFNFNDKSAAGSTTSKGLGPNTFAYPQDYFGTIEIIQYFDEDEDQQEVFSVQLEEAYPIAMGDIQLDWNNTDTLTKISVTFTYTYWSSSSLDDGKIDSASRARVESLKSNQTRIDSNLSSVRTTLEAGGQAVDQFTSRYNIA